MRTAQRPGTPTTDADNPQQSDAANGTQLTLETHGRVRLESLTIRNYKAIDELTLHFPLPDLPGDPDVMVIGSRNGVGKTSVLECCVLLLAAAALGNEGYDLKHFPNPSFDIPGLLIRAGAEELCVSGHFSRDDYQYEVRTRLNKNGGIQFEASRKTLDDAHEMSQSPEGDDIRFVQRIFLTLAGLYSEPLAIGPFMYFDSYRRVAARNPKLADMVQRGFASWGTLGDGPGVPDPVSLFKTEVLSAMMGRGGLLED